MKGRIGKYKDKIVVWGDPNLTAKNEINIDSLEGGEGQSSIPVEYYKVVALEGENLDEVRHNVYFAIGSILDYAISNFYILVKGTSSSNGYKLFTGLSILSAINIENLSFHAYSIREFQIITKIVRNDGTIREIPSFNNIFDAVGSIEDLPEEMSPSYLKKHLVPITAEEFYNLDDIE